MDLITENRLARRASIMAAARTMIAEYGYDALTIRDLAQACRVSVPTLYNQFGGKDQLLAAAIEDHFTGNPNQMSFDPDLPGLERIFAILDFIADQFLASPAFHRRLLEAFGSLDSTTSVQKKITLNLAQAISKELTGMQAKAELSDWVHCQTLSGQVTTAFVSATVIWASGDVSDDQLRAAIRYGTGLVLLGVVTPELRVSIEDRLTRAQTQLCEPTSEPAGRDPINKSVAQSGRN